MSRKDVANGVSIRISGHTITHLVTKRSVLNTANIYGLTVLSAKSDCRQMRSLYQDQMMNN